MAVSSAERAGRRRRAVEQRAHERLGVVGRDGPAAVAGADQRGERACTTVVAEQLAGSHATSPSPASVHERQARRAASGPRCPPTRRATASGSPASAGQPRRALRTASAGVVDARRPRPRAPRPRAADAPRSVAERLDQAVAERAELEEVEQPADLVGVDGALRRGRRGRRRAATSRSSTMTSAFWRTCASCSARFVAQLGRLLVEVGEDAVEAAVGVDELGRRLLPHAGHAGQVVGRVAPQRRVLRGTGAGVHAGALLDAGLVVEHVVGHAPAVVEHLDVRVLDELVGVAVAGDDDDVVAPRPRPWVASVAMMSSASKPASSSDRDRRASRPPGAPGPSAGAGCRAPPPGWPCSRRPARGGTSARAGRRPPRCRRAGGRAAG